MACMHALQSSPSIVAPRACRTPARSRRTLLSQPAKLRIAHCHRPTTRHICRCSAEGRAQPEQASGAIALGLKAYEQQDYSEAVRLFKQALTLPGSGLKQYRDKPALPSDGEKISAFYNIACCLSRTGNTNDGLMALFEALQMGYEDFDQIRQDPDLEGLRKDSKFEPLLQRFQKVNRKNMLQNFFENVRNPLQQK